MTSSNNTVVKTVAKKLKYYFEVKRLEDGFDLSDVNAPVLAHPPLKAPVEWNPLLVRSTLQYDGLHDRPLKHYFSQPEVRVQLTQLGVPVANGQLRNPRERHIKKSLTRGMRKHHFLRTAPDLPTVVPTEKVNNNNKHLKYGSRVTKKPNIPDCYYVYTPAGMKIHPSMVGYGGAPKTQKKKSLKGGWPAMRSAPPVNISRGEAERLVNSATRLLAATETIEHMSKSQQWAGSKGRLTQSAPRSFETEWDLIRKLDPTFTASEVDDSKDPRTGKRRPLTAKYTWDINGHRVPSAKVKAYDDSYLDRIPRRSYLRPRRSPSPESSEATPPRRPSPPPAKPPFPPPVTVERPHSSKRRERTIINLPSEQIRDEVRVTRSEPPKYEMSSQTDRHLLDEYDHMEEEVKEGPWGEYQVYIRTGDRIGASTSADVKLTIYGEKGRTQPLKLATSKYNKVKFQRGKEDLFILAAHHVGKMRKVKIGHDRSQLSYAWFLENVTIFDMNDKRIYDFPCERWLSGQDDDHRTYRMLPVDRQRAFVDALEKSDPHPPPENRKSKSDSESSDTESDSTSHRKDRASMRPKRSQRSRRSSSNSSSTSSSETNTDDEAVIRMSAPSTPKEGNKKEAAKKEKDDFFDQKQPGTVIQFKKKDSQKVEEEVVLNERGKDRRAKPVPEQEYLAGYKAGLEAVEAKERKHKEDERVQERQLLSGPSIHDACRSGDLERVKELLDKFPEMKDFRDESSWTPLHLAAANGHVDIIKWLTSAGRDDLDVETPTGYTPTHVAAMNGHMNAVLVLHAMGADVGCKTVDKQTPLHLAARAGHLDCVKWLVANRVDLTVEDSFGRTALHLADEYGQTTVVDFLRVCERDLADPNSTFAQMHRAQQRGGSVALPTIREDDKGSSSSEHVQTGNSSTGAGRKTKAKEDRELQEKRKMYEEQHRHMEQQGVSFLDSIRQESEA